METLAVVVETVAALFVFAWFGVGAFFKAKDGVTAWRKHWEAYRYWKAIRGGRAGV